MGPWAEGHRAGRAGHVGERDLHSDRPARSDGEAPGAVKIPGSKGHSHSGAFDEMAAPEESCWNERRETRE